MCYAADDEYEGSGVARTLVEKGRHTCTSGWTGSGHASHTENNLTGSLTALQLQTCYS